AIWRVLPKRNRKLWFLFLSAAGSWANSILTATSLLPSRVKTANWLNTAPLWLANNWKNLPPEPGRIVPSRENEIPVKRVVAALILKNGKVLVCQRTRHQTMPLKWEFPGGKIEEGEQPRSEEHTSELQSRGHLVCRLLLEKKKQKETKTRTHNK